MTPREALFILDDENKCSKRDIEAFTVLKDFITASEQVPTLEKLGYVRLETKNEKILRKYKRREYTITFSNGIYGDGEIIVSKQDIDGYWYSFTKSELLALAEVIKEIEEEKMKEKEETK